MSEGKNPHPLTDRLPFGGVLIPPDAAVFGYEQFVKTGQNRRHRLSLRFCGSSATYFIVEGWLVTITKANPLNWPAILFTPTDEFEGVEWPIDYLHYLGEVLTLDPLDAEIYSEYASYVQEALSIVMSLQQTAMRYLQYYGVPVEKIVSKYLELAKSVPSEEGATGAPPIGIYLWLNNTEGATEVLGLDFSKPVNAIDFFARFNVLRKEYRRDYGIERPMPWDIPELRELDREFTVIVPLPNPGGLQDLLRLGDLSVRPSDKEYEVGIIEVKASENPDAKKMLKPNKIDPYELAIAILALLDKPLTEAYTAIPRSANAHGEKEAREGRRRRGGKA
jgi:hypothetical protein